MNNAAVLVTTKKYLRRRKVVLNTVHKGRL